MSPVLLRLFKIKDPKGTIKYQAVFYGTMPTLAPFSHAAEDEMEQIRLWNLKEDIGYVDECDLKIVELVTGNMNNPETSFTIRQSSARDKDMKPAADEGFILLSKEL